MRTNLTYQPQPALCYISKTSELGVTTDKLAISNIQFNVTTFDLICWLFTRFIFLYRKDLTSYDYLSVILIVGSVLILNMHIDNNNLSLVIPGVVILNRIFPTGNCPVVTQSAVF